MIKLECDKCKKDCGLVAFDVLVRVLHNPEPVSIKDTGNPQITCENTSLRMLLCQDCYKKLGLPNVYSSLNNNKIEFRSNDKNTEER